jgi:hypothetical protein
MEEQLELGLSWIAHKVTPQQRSAQAKVRSPSALVTTMVRSVKRIVGAVETNLGNAKVDRIGGIALFLIAQGSAHKCWPACSSSATIALMKQHHDLMLSGKDNGKGITKKAIQDHNSLGIIGIRERALAFDETLTLRWIKIEGDHIDDPKSLDPNSYGYTAQDQFPQNRIRSIQLHEKFWLHQPRRPHSLCSARCELARA